MPRKPPPPINHGAVMARLNPEGWSPEQWSAFVVRMAIDGGYRARVERRRAERHAWAAEQVRAMSAGRRVNTRLVHQWRLEANDDARVKIPNPDPFEGGWRPPANVDPLRALGVKVQAGGAR